MPYPNRTAAGRVLALELERLRSQDPIVLALTPGGVEVGAVIAKHLDAPLDVLVVRKLIVPGESVLAMGALAAGVRVENQRVIRELEISPQTLDEVTERETKALAEQSARYRGHTPEPDVKGRTVILVDDGVSTGATLRVGGKALRMAHAERIVVAIPVAPKSTLAVLELAFDEIVCPVRVEDYPDVSGSYASFEPVADEEVVATLSELNLRESAR